MVNYKNIFLGGLIVGTGLGLSYCYYEDPEDYKMEVKNGELVKTPVNKFRARLLRKGYNILVKNGLSFGLVISGYVLVLDNVVNGFSICPKIAQC